MSEANLFGWKASCEEHFSGLKRKTLSGVSVYPEMSPAMAGFGKDQVENPGL